jgi:hypothetical protein
MSTRDTRISEIFYYFERDTNIATGRTVGRKIGVIQEIIVKKFLLTELSIRDCLIYEPRLRGKSGATHKVEFVLFNPLVVALIAKGERFRTGDPALEITVRKIDSLRGRASLTVLTGEGPVTRTLGIEQALSISLATDGRSKVFFVKLVEVSDTRCRVSILDAQTPLASLESKRVGAQRFSGSDALGSGIQTIEKAKQTSLVAVDFDLQFNEMMLSQGAPDSPRQFRSFALLGNGVHWTDHDLSVLQTYVDFTIQVKDEAIVRYAEFVRGLAEASGKPFLGFFMSYFNGMTRTPGDSFQVNASDFVLLRPRREAGGGWI